MRTRCFTGGNSTAKAGWGEDGHAAAARKGLRGAACEAAKGDSPALRSGTMEIKLSKGTIRIAGSVDVVALRTVLECLAR